MSRKKKLHPCESVQREIARRLQAGLPLAGMIAATTLLTGCHEHSENFPAGSVPRDPALYERQTEKPKPKTPHRPKNNGKSEQHAFRTTGMVASPEPNRRNETENDVPMGDVEPPPNRKNENVDPASTMGRYPAKPENKGSR